jgi:hypothetical protein
MIKSYILDAIDDLYGEFFMLIASLFKSIWLCKSFIEFKKILNSFSSFTKPQLFQELLRYSNATF